MNVNGIVRELKCPLINTIIFSNAIYYTLNKNLKKITKYSII